MKTTQERQQRERERRRRQILRAALTVFAEQGYHGATIEAIAERCALSKGLLYFYFNSKEDLLAQVVQEKFAELLTELEAAAAGEAPPAERLQRMVRAQLRYYARNRAFYQLLARLSGGTGLKGLARQQRSRIKAHLDRELQLVRAVIAEGIARGDFRSSDPETLVHALGGLIHGLALQRDRGRFDPDALAEEVCELFFHGVLNPRR